MAKKSFNTPLSHRWILIGVHCFRQLREVFLTENPPRLLANGPGMTAGLGNKKSMHIKDPKD